MSLTESLVFIPGTLCDERLWLPVWRLMSMGERAYAPLQWANSFDEMLALVADRVEQSANKPHLVGFSMGGYVASRYALQNPNKVASLTLIGYATQGLLASELEQRQQLIEAIDKGLYKA